MRVMTPRSIECSDDMWTVNIISMSDKIIRFEIVLNNVEEWTDPEWSRLLPNNPLLSLSQRYVIERSRSRKEPPELVETIEEFVANNYVTRALLLSLVDDDINSGDTHPIFYKVGLYNALDLLWD